MEAVIYICQPVCERLARPYAFSLENLLSLVDTEQRRLRALSGRYLEGQRSEYFYSYLGISPGSMTQGHRGLAVSA